MIAATVASLSWSNDVIGRTTLANVFNLALGKRTGTIAAVVPPEWSGEWPCNDAVVLRDPLDLARLTTNAPGRLEVSYVPLPQEALAASMLQEDGIVVFDSAARLRAYRWFVPFTWEGHRLPGGARERAFRSLTDFVAAGVLNAAFVQSSDGTMVFVDSEAAQSSGSVRELAESPASVAAA